MSHLLEPYIDCKNISLENKTHSPLFLKIGKIEIITNDGRVMVGILKGYDQVINIILSDCEERVYSSKGVEIVHLGLYVIRGDDV